MHDPLLAHPGPFITHIEAIDTADVMLYNQRCKARLTALAAKGFTHVVWPNLKTPYGTGEPFGLYVLPGGIWRTRLLCVHRTPRCL